MSRWRADLAWTAEPFLHAVVDDACTEPDALLAVLEEEAVERYESEIALFEASAVTPGAELVAIRDDFARAYAPALPKPTRTADMRAYAYRPGHYLLPHTDHREGLERVFAYAYYLPSPEPCTGGELELFRCTLDGDAISAVASGRVIDPRANRLVIFDVGDGSLHQVREVLGGLRLSLAGWFYP